MRINMMKLAVAGILMCVLAPTASAVTDFNQANESIFVMRVKTYPNSKWLGRVIYFNGKLVDESGFKFSLFTPARFTDVTDDGFVVGRSKHGEWVALSNIGSNVACRSGSTLAFRVEPGKVAYVGEVIASANGVGFDVAVQQDEAAARAFLERRHPQLAARMEKVEARVVTADHKCVRQSQTIYIHI